MTDSSQEYSPPLYGTSTFTNSESPDSDRSSSSGDDVSSIPIFPITSYAGRILSMITERTEPTTSRPPSGVHRPESAVPESLRRSARLGGRSSSPSQHVRASTGLALPQHGRAGELIAFFEDKNADTAGHSRAASAPEDQRLSSPYVPASQSTPVVGSTTAYGTGYSSRSSSPVKRHSGSTVSSASSASVPISSLISPPLRGFTSVSATETWTDTRTRTGTTYQSPGTFTDTFSNTFTPTNTFTATAPVTGTPVTSPLRRPQTSPRSPLASVRNIVAAWKERTPGSPKSSPPGTATSASSPYVPGHLGLRRQPARIGLRRDDRSESRGSSDAPLDLADLTSYTRGHAKPDRIGLLWYLNVHTAPPYRWQRCQALLYPHMLLLTWIAPAGGRGVVSLDLLNCTSVVSVPSPTHPSAQDDVGTIAAQLQSAEPGGPPLMHTLVPFHLLYGDGVERLAAESLLERQRWVNYLWDTIHRPMIERSEPRSPTGSIRTIQSEESRSSVSSSTGSTSTVFVPPSELIPEIFDTHSHISGLSRQASLISSHHTGTVDDSAIRGQEYVYPGDPRVIPPSRHGSLRRTTSLTELDKAFISSVPQTQPLRLGRRLMSRRDTTLPGSSESSLGTDLRILSIGDKSRSSGSAASLSDKEFFSASPGALSTESRSTFYSTTSVTGQGTTTFTGPRTDEMTPRVTSATSPTQVMSSTLSPGPTESSTFTMGSPLSGSRDARRTPRSSSRTFSSSYDSYYDESSDKENSEPYTPSASQSYTASGTRSYTPLSSSRSYTPSGTRSYTSSRSSSETPGIELSHSSEFSPLSFPCSSVSRTPTPSTRSTERESEVYITPPSVGSTEYMTARSPVSEYGSLPTIPSESEYGTAEICSEYVTAEICPSEPSTTFTTAEICSTHPEDIPLPFSSPSEVSSPATIPTISDLDLGLIPLIDPTLVSLPPSEDSLPSSESSVFVSTPTISVSGPTVISSVTPTAAPRTRTTLTTITESDIDLTPSSPSPSPSPPPPPSPSAHPSLWAPETNLTYESSILRPSPSVASHALPEAPDISFETSHLRPSSSVISSLERLTPRLRTPTTPSLSVPKSPSPLPPVSSPTSFSSPSWEESITSVSSLSRTVSSVSGVSSISMRSSALDARSLWEVPLSPGPSTVPSLLSTHRATTPERLSTPCRVPLPSSPAPSTPSVSMSVSISTPQTNIPSVHTLLDTIPSEAGPSEFLTQDINRLVQYIRDLDQLRGQESHEMADNIRAIRDELYDLSDHLRRQPEPGLDRSDGMISELMPEGPIEPVLLTPPPFRVPSPTTIASRSMSFLSSHHSDDYIGSPRWSPASTLILEGISSPHTPPPISRTPPSPSPSSRTPPPISSTPPSPTLSSTSTARPPRSLTDLRDTLNIIKDKVSGLSDGQNETNRKLDAIQGLISPRPDEDLRQRLNRLEGVIQQLLDRLPAERPISHVTESTEPSSDYASELDSLLRRFREATTRERPVLALPPFTRPGLSLDDELAAMLRAPIPPAVREIQGPPPLKPFVYHPAPRAARPRSASPTALRRPSTVPITVPVDFGDEERPPRSIRDRDSEISYRPVIPRRPPPQEQILQDVRPQPPGPRLPGPPAQPVLPTSLYDRPPTAPPSLGQERPPGTGPSWYRPQPAPGAAPAPAFIPMPPGPTVVQVPLFDTLMEILRENRLAQLATVEQQRELMRYMRALNGWLDQDVRDRQAQLQDINTRLDQMQHGIVRLGVPVQPEVRSGAPFIVPPLPQVGPQPPFGPPPGFVQQVPGAGPPVIPGVVPGIHPSAFPIPGVVPSVHPSVIPMPVPDVGAGRVSPPVIPHLGRTPARVSRLADVPIVSTAADYPPGPPVIPYGIRPDAYRRASPSPSIPYVPSEGSSPSVVMVPPPQPPPQPVIITQPPVIVQAPPGPPVGFPVSQIPTIVTRRPSSVSSTVSSRRRSPTFIQRPSEVPESERRSPEPRRPSPVPPQAPAPILVQMPPQQVPFAPPLGPLAVAPVPAPFFPGVPTTYMPGVPTTYVPPPPTQIIEVRRDERSPRRRTRSPDRSPRRRRSPIRESDRPRDRSPRRESPSPPPRRRRPRRYSPSPSYYSPERPAFLVSDREPRYIARSRSRSRSPRLRRRSPTRRSPPPAAPVTIIQPPEPRREWSRSRSPPLLLARPPSRERRRSPPPAGPIIIQPTAPPVAPSTRLTRRPRSRSRSRSPPIIIQPGVPSVGFPPLIRPPSPTVIYARPRTPSPRRRSPVYRDRRPTRRPPSSYRSRSYSPRRPHRHPSYYSPERPRLHRPRYSRSLSPEYRDREVPSPPRDRYRRRARRIASPSPTDIGYRSPTERERLRRRLLRSPSPTERSLAEREAPRRRRARSLSPVDRSAAEREAPRRRRARSPSPVDRSAAEREAPRRRRARSPSPVERSPTERDRRRVRPARSPSPEEPERRPRRPLEEEEREGRPPRRRPSRPDYEEEEVPDRRVPHRITVPSRRRTPSPPSVHRPSSRVSSPVREPIIIPPTPSVHEPVTPRARRTPLPREVLPVAPVEALVPVIRPPVVREEDRRRRRPRTLSSTPSPVRRVRAPSPVSIIQRVPAPRSPVLPALSYDDAERERQERFHDLQSQMDQATQTVIEGEEQREAEFRRNEEARQEFFQEHEARRDEESARRRDEIWRDLENRLAAAPPVPEVREPPPAETESLRSVRQVVGDATSRYADDILETVKAEREELARESEAAAAERERLEAELSAERNRLDEERDARIRALEEELANVRTELDNEKQLRITEEAETRERERLAAQERDDALRNQLADITNLIQEQRDFSARKQERMDARWEEKQERRRDKDSRLAEIRDAVERILQDREADRLRAEEERTEERPATDRIIEELQRQNLELRELLNNLSDNWRADCERHHRETIDAVRATANEQVHFNVQGYLDDFCKALSSEVKVLLSEVGKLREERRALLHELGALLTMKSRFGPGGEFDPDWHPLRPPSAGPGGPPADGPPPQPPIGPEEQPPTRPAWRTVHPRAPRKQKLKKEPPQPSAPGPAAVATDPRHQITSWATWQPNPSLAPTPPSVEPTLLVPDRGSPGLFGPRSPRDSYHRG